MDNVAPTTNRIVNHNIGLVHNVASIAIANKQSPKHFLLQQSSQQSSQQFSQHLSQQSPPQFLQQLSQQLSQQSSQLPQSQSQSKSSGMITVCDFVRSKRTCLTDLADNTVGGQTTPQLLNFLDCVDAFIWLKLTAIWI